VAKSTPTLAKNSQNTIAVPTGNDTQNDLLTVSEVARILRVDDTTVRRWVKQGALEAVVLPHINARQAYRIKRITLSKLLGEQAAV
jgi:excisionase family DNA binding protein